MILIYVTLLKSFGFQVAIVKLSTKLNNVQFTLHYTEPCSVFQYVVRTRSYLIFGLIHVKLIPHKKVE